ncbi:MAG: carboxypeptidase-like regulatory domain-containing protein [Pyrinomonadaceae bacterium]
MKKSKLAIVALLLCASAIAQTGGGFDLQQNVIGNGGWRSDGGGFTVLGTMGQSNSGSPTSGGGFHIIDGLWAIENLSPASPFATVSGHVTKGGVGIPRVLITASSPSTGLTFWALSGPHGEYSLGDIPVGASYLITADHKHFRIQPSSVSLFISQDRTDVDFVITQ